MALWLFKEEPTHYSYADLEKDGSAALGRRGERTGSEELAASQERRPHLLLPHGEGKGRGGGDESSRRRHGRPQEQGCPGRGGQGGAGQAAAAAGHAGQGQAGNLPS